MNPVSVPTPISPAMIIWPPNHRSATLATFIESVKTGVLITAVLKVRVAALARRALTFSKRSAT